MLFRSSNCCEEVAAVVIGDFCAVTGIDSGISSSRGAFVLGLGGFLDVFFLVFLVMAGVGFKALVVLP